VAKTARSPLRRAPNLPRPVLDNAVASVPEIIVDPAVTAEDRGVIVVMPQPRVTVRK